MELFIEVFVFASTLYSIIGVGFAGLFLAFGLENCDPAAVGSTPWFRVMVAPGLVVFWPVFAIRWIIGLRRPPQERNAHRIAAKAYHHR
jgi:hypothetical protein